MGISLGAAIRIRTVSRSIRVTMISILSPTMMVSPTLRDKTSMLFVFAAGLIPAGSRSENVRLKMEPRKLSMHPNCKHFNHCCKTPNLFWGTLLRTLLNSVLSSVIPFRIADANPGPIFRFECWSIWIRNTSTSGRSDDQKIYFVKFFTNTLAHCPLPF